MFVARSTARIRRARLVFLAAGLAPTLALLAWATYLHSGSHRAAVERRWQEAVGVPLSVGSVEYPRPGVIRARGCVVLAADDRPSIELPLLEIESSADEDRLRIARLGADTGTAAVAVDLARRWLDDAVRFRRAFIIEVADFSWAEPTGLPDADATAASAVPLRVECVAIDGSRAIRIVRRGPSVDEVRIVKHPAADRGSAVHFEIDATCVEPVPLSLIMRATGGGSRGPTTGKADAQVTGTLHAALTSSGWEGLASGRITGLDLAPAAAALGDRAEGTATVDISRLAWAEGRVSDALVECITTGGRIDRRLFDRVVLALAARPGPAAARVGPAEMLEFDAAACIVAVGPHGVQVQPNAKLPAGLATSRGEVLLAPPSGAVTADRVAWLFSSPGTTYGPTAGPGAWLMSVLPSSAPQPAATDDGKRF